MLMRVYSPALAMLRRAPKREREKNFQTWQTIEKRERAH